jgi:hypothetical protein
MKKQNIEDIFSSMEDFSSVPPPELWGQIEEKLDKPKKKKKVILWWSAAACLLLGLLLPSVLHFNSDPGIKNINNGATENNSVVLDEKKHDLENNRSIPTDENNVETKSGINSEISSDNNSKNQSNNPKEDLLNQESAVAHADSKEGIQNNVSDPKSNSVKTNVNQAVAEKKFTPGKENQLNANSKFQTPNSAKRNANQAVAEKTFTAGKENQLNANSKFQTPNLVKRNSNQAVAEKTFTAGKENQLNADSKFETPNSVKRNANQTVAEKTFTAGKENQLNADSKFETTNSVKRNANQAVAEKTFTIGKQDQLNADSKFETPNSTKRNANQAVAEKSFTTGKQDQFNTLSKNQKVNAERKTADKILAEKTFNAGKTNGFNTGSKNKVSNSIFEDKLTSNNKANNGLAFNPANSGLNNNQAFIAENKAKQNIQSVLSEKAVASNQKSNSKASDVLSKKDSVQLAELQNLEKGIAATPEDKKEKETKTLSNAEKWDVAVFAGVASSENYKNDKTLGNVNDSKQGTAYGVKTKYKINKKWAVGSGFKINELGQSIANVSYINSKMGAASLSPSFYFNQNETTATPQIVNNPDYVFVSNSTVMAFKNNDIQSDASSNIQTGNLDQNLRYLEMPVEVSYAFFTKNKASISVNTGGFVGKLISNNAALDGNSIGQNLNANDFVYGSTLSSTVQYRIYKKTNIFAEPAINYYINPLNNQSFNQFQWGLNFGLNVSF